MPSSNAKSGAKLKQKGLRTFFFVFFTYFQDLFAVGNPFSVFWNAPSSRCGFLNVSAKYSMTANDGEKFRGDKIVILYDHDFGAIPYYDRKNNSYRFGGIPQLGEWDKHLKKLRKDIEKMIPEGSFNGLAILDWEEWRPKWYTMWRDDPLYKPYRELALQTTRRKHWKYAHDPGVIEWLAAIDWDRSANKWLKETLKECKRLRPKASWGFYHYPDCYQYKNHNCKKIAVRANDDQYSWMWKSQDAYFPCGYHGIGSIHSLTHELHRLQKKRRREIRSQRRHFHMLKYSRRFKRQNGVDKSRQKGKWRSFGHWDQNGKFVPRGGPVNDKPWYLYLKFSEESTGRNCYEKGSKYQFLNYWRLMQSMSHAWAHNAAGVILWDSSCFYNSRIHPNYCEDLKNYMDKILGPMAKYLIHKPHTV